jgi:hypothetical protein
VLLASARDGTGVPALLAARERPREHQVATGGQHERPPRGREGVVRVARERRDGSYGRAPVGGQEGIRARCRERSSTSSFLLASELGDEIEDALRKAIA